MRDYTSKLDFHYKQNNHKCNQLIKLITDTFLSVWQNFMNKAHAWQGHSGDQKKKKLKIPKARKPKAEPGYQWRGKATETEIKYSLIRFVFTQSKGTFYWIFCKKFYWTFYWIFCKTFYWIFFETFYIVDLM